MALTLLSDLKPYDQQFRSGYMLGLTYFINLFNQGSNGTIRLESENTPSTLKKEAFFNDFGTMARRDITVDTAQTAEKITRNDRTMFKTFWKFIPQEFQWTAFKTSDAMTPEAVMVMIGRKLAEKKIAYSVGRALAIVSAAIGSQAAMVIDHETTPANLTISDIILGKSKFGDAAPRLRALVMHSAAYYPLIADQVANYKFDTGAGIVMYGGTPATMNVPVIVTDNPELTYTGDDSATYYKTLFLADAAVTIADNGDTTAVADTVTGNENIKTLFQAEGDIWNYVKGYQLKAAASPQSNPEDSVLATSSNWERWVNTDKLTAGVLIKSLGSLADVRQVTDVRIVS